MCPERVHWDEEFALEVGAPGAYDYGPERCSWLTHHLTNWMGDDGFLRRAECKVRRHNPEGDLLFIKGSVTRKFVADGKHLVEIAQQAQALGLRHVAGNRLRVEAVRPQQVFEFLGAAPEGYVLEKVLAQ